MQKLYDADYGGAIYSSEPLTEIEILQAQMKIRIEREAIKNKKIKDLEAKLNYLRFQFTIGFLLIGLYILLKSIL